MGDRWYGLLIPLFLLVVSSCDRPFYSEEKIIPGSVWTYADSTRFDWEIRDTQKLYDLWLNVHHTLDLSHQNVYVQATTGFPQGPDQVQLLSLELLKPDGQPNGNCRSDQCTAFISLGEKLSFPSPGSYSLSLAQYSRRDSMPGIHSIRLEIREHRE
jgi:gliding motility-associated lipoprotein GldH